MGCQWVHKQPGEMALGLSLKRMGRLAMGPWVGEKLKKTARRLISYPRSSVASKGERFVIIKAFCDLQEHQSAALMSRSGIAWLQLPCGEAAKNLCATLRPSGFIAQVGLGNSTTCVPVLVGGPQMTVQRVLEEWTQVGMDDRLLHLRCQTYLENLQNYWCICAWFTRN